MAVITRWSYKRGGRKAGSHVSGSFSNDDCKDNENVRKTIGLLRKTTSLHVQHAFLYISLLLLHGYYVKMPNFMFNHNYNKIVKSDWLSTALISALIGQFNRTVRAITRALKWLFFHC